MLLLKDSYREELVLELWKFVLFITALWTFLVLVYILIVAVVDPIPLYEVLSKLSVLLNFFSESYEDFYTEVLAVKLPSKLLAHTGCFSLFLVRK